MGLHFAISAATNFLCSAGSTRLSVTTTAPKPSCFLMKSGFFNAVFKATLSLSNTSGGVPLGAYRPCQMVTSKPLSPASSFDLGGEYKFGILQVGLGYGKDIKEGGLVAPTATTSDFKEKNQLGLRLSTGSISPYIVTGTDKYVQAFDAKTKMATNRAKVNYSIVGADYSTGKHTVALNFLSRDIQSQLVGVRKMTQLGYTYNLSPKDTIQAYIQNDGVDNSKTNNHVKVFGTAYLYRF